MSAAFEIIQSILFRDRDQHAIPALDGAYTPNNRLEQMLALELDLSAPDDLAADGKGGFFIADLDRLVHVSGLASPDIITVLQCDAPITALARLSDGSLVVALNGQGIRHLDEAGQLLEQVDKLQGKSLRCVTALAEDPRHGGVYFTVGSTRHNAEDWVWDLMEDRKSTGLLAHWSFTEEEPEVLLQDLAYPNGVLTEENGTSLLFTQSWDHCLCRYFRDTKAVGSEGGYECIVGNMPGYPARIAPASGGGFWLALLAMRTELVELVLKEKSFKREMMRVVEPELWVRPALYSTGSHLEPLQGGGIKKLGIRKPWAPPRSYGLVVRMDSECEPISSLHSRVDGENHGVMAAREIEGRLVVAAKGRGRLLIEDSAG